MDTLTDLFALAQQWLFETVVQPLALLAGQANILEKAYEGTGWLLVGLIQITLMLVLIGPMQRLWPAEVQHDRQAVRVDVLYTLLHRLGLFKLLMFFSFDALFEQGLGQLRAMGLPTWHLDALWPGVTDQAWVSFVLYLVLFDLVNYWIHRGQHAVSAWWELHALHHSQRHMTAWTDNRNHLLDDVIHDAVFVFVGLVIGVAPAQFVAVVVVMQLVENLSHANLRWSFGTWGDQLLVSPKFHRRHHAIEPLEAFHRQRARAVRGVNYGVLFPVWDRLFGTADHSPGYPATGLRDQLPQHGGRDYGQGFWAQQWLGLKRLWGRA